MTGWGKGTKWYHSGHVSQYFQNSKLNVQLVRPIQTRGTLSVNHEKGKFT